MSALHTFPGPDNIKRVVLPNEITILARANFNSPSVVINGYIQAGSLQDPGDRLGLADFTASALMRGTARHDFQSIYDLLESVGASLGFSGGTHITSFGGRALVEDLDMVLMLLVECLQEPTFPAEHLERLRTQHLTALAIRAQDTAEMASLTFDEILYANHPYGKPDEGYPETIRNIDRSDIIKFHRQNYGPQGGVIAIAGGIETQNAVDRVAEALGGWENSDQAALPELPPIQPLSNEVRRHVTIPGKSQADVMMGTIGPRRKSPDFMAATLGNNILGQFGMYGRIGDSVRERAGLAYYAYSNVHGGIGPGVWYAGAGVDPTNVNKTIELIRNEIKNFTTELVSEEELQDSKSNFLGRLPISLESNAGVAGGLAYIERHGLGLDYYYRYHEMIEAVRREDILEVARSYLHPDQMVIVDAG